MIDFSTNVGGGTTRLPMVRYGFDLTPATQLFLAAENQTQLLKTSNQACQH